MNFVAGFCFSKQSSVATLRSCAHSCLSCDNIFLLRHFSFLQYDNSVMTEFLLLRQYYVHSSNMYVETSIPMSQHSFSAASASWCRDPAFLVATAFLFWFLLQQCLVLLSSRSRSKKSVAIEFCRHLACFLIAASFFMLRPRHLCWGCFACRDPNMLCHDNTFLCATYFPVAT